MTLYECNIPCEYKNPLGYCMLTYCAKKEIELPNGPFEKDYQPSGITIDPNKLPSEMRGLNDEGVKIAEAIVYLTTHGWTCIAPQGIDAIALQKAASNLVDAVDRYTMGRCLRSELLNKNNELKRLLNDNQTTPTPLVQVSKMQ